MASSYSRARYRPHPAKPNDGPAPNLSARGFDGCKPRTHLAADPAYVRAGNSWAYICLPGDLANREIAGHSVGVRHDPDLVPLSRHTRPTSSSWGSARSVSGCPSIQQ